MQDVIGKTGSFAKQFVVGGVTQFVEGRQVCWAVSRRPGETASRTGGVRQTSDDGGTVHVLQSCVTEPTSMQQQWLTKMHKYEEEISCVTSSITADKKLTRRH